MSRIGNQPIQVPAKVEVTLAPGAITVKGPLGTLTRSYGSDLSIERSGDTLVCKTANETARAMHGTLRALVANMVKGVTDGFERKLEINGVGYRAEVAGQKLNMALGFSHPVVFELPKGIAAKVDKNVVILTGIDREVLGETASKIRAIRPPEPYKGKGIKYVEEVIQRKVGKTGAA